MPLEAGARHRVILSRCKIVHDRERWSVDQQKMMLAA
jgi:hypothetical protein